ncbi:MAG: ABC transporter permease [Oscillospiraceae bacterium]|nr:ABC transporter permease [Oscillospiraceae bacterium]MBQ7130161.1 ABC transporter permease [Oscillospiraceae bacterium]
MANSTQNHHIHISSRHNILELNLKEVWKYRDLIILFTRRSFSLLYKQTILGPAWVFLNPLISSLVYAFVFGGIAGIDTDGVPTVLFYLCSNAIWIFFSSCVTRNANTFTANAAVFGKVYFPRLTIPVSNVLSSFIQFFVQMILVFVFLIFYVIRGQVTPHWEFWVLIPLLLIHLGVLGLGVGVIISSLTTKYRDLAILVTFGIQLWMYVTPIVYPISQIEEGVMRTILMTNPVTAPTEMIRYALLGQGEVLPGYMLLSAAVTVLVMTVGIMIFNKVEKTFMDTV